MTSAYRAHIKYVTTYQCTDLCLSFYREIKYCWDMFLFWLKKNCIYFLCHILNITLSYLCVQLKIRAISGFHPNSSIFRILWKEIIWSAGTKIAPGKLIRHVQQALLTSPAKLGRYIIKLQNLKMIFITVNFFNQLHTSVVLD